MSHIYQCTPLLHVPDLVKALDLFTRVLGFDIKFRAGDYAYLERGEAGLRILEETDRELPAAGEKTRLTVYFDVSDVDELYAETLPALMTLPPGDVHAPIDQPWNQREFHVRLPDGQWMAFGQPVKTARKT